MNPGHLGRGATGVRAIVTILFLLAVCASTTRATIVKTVTAKADAYVRSESEKKTFGFETRLDLHMNSSDGVAEGYVQFPLPQHATFAEKIVLRIYAQLAEPGSAQILVRSVAASNWTEMKLSWRTRPEHKETLGIVNIVGLSGAWYEVDVTSFVRAEAALGREAATFALIPGGETKHRISVLTHESTVKKPELVFSRQPITARISFISTNSVPVEGFLADQGDVFGPRTNGYTYGWNVSNRDFMRDRRDARNAKLKSPGRVYDFLGYMDYEKMKAPASWEMALPNGEFRVRIVAGDLQRYDSIFAIKAENILVVDGIPDTNKRWIDGTSMVTVTDGRLSITNAPGSSNNKLCFIEVTEVENLLTQSK